MPTQPSMLARKLFQANPPRADETPGQYGLRLAALASLTTIQEIREELQEITNAT